MLRDELVGNKRVFYEDSAHSKAVLNDSLITVDTTSLDQRASKEVTRVIFQVLRHPRLFLIQWLFPYQ